MSNDMGIDAEDSATSGTAGSDANVKYWLRQISDARKREKTFRKDGKRINSIYEAEEKDEFQFNILYSNTETLAPALYNQLPTPSIRRRFNDDDPIALIGAKVTDRIIRFLLDSNDEDFAAFDDLMADAVVQALVPGRGLVRYKYTADFTDVVVPKVQSADIAAEAAKKQGLHPDNFSPNQEPASVDGKGYPGDADGDSDAATGQVDGKDPDGETIKKVSYETVVGEVVPWDRLLHGYAKSWQNVPWQAIEHFMTREECEKNFPDVGSKIPLTVSYDDDSDDTKENNEKPSDAQGAKLAHIYEIWNKTDRTVYFVAEGYKAGYVKVVPDPLKLHGFYPWPKPMTMTRTIKSLVPKALYMFYEEQAKELNTCTVRINKILRALKVRGIYDGTIRGLDKLMTEADGALLPAENVSAMQQGQTLERAIWFMPIDKLVLVLQQLIQTRTAIKQTIYEITGISDILRGQGAASESATAQNIKNQWGTLRLQKMQKEVQRFVRDSIRIIAEIAYSKFSIDTIAKMTGCVYPTEAQHEAAQQAVTEITLHLKQIELMEQEIQQEMKKASQATTTQTGQPTAPGAQLPPQLQELEQAAQQQLQALQARAQPFQQQLQKAQAVLAQPTWESIMELMRSDLYSRFRVDIQTNSTISADATEDKQNIGEFMNALSQFMNGIQPMISEGIMPFNAAKSMLLAITRRFQFGNEVEEELEQMQPPQQHQDGKVQADMAKAKMDLQITQAEGQAKLQQIQAESEARQKEQQFKLIEMQQKAEEQKTKHNLAMKDQQMRMAQQQQKFEHEMQIMTAATQAKLTEIQAQVKLKTTPQARPPKPAGGGSNTK